MRFFIFLLAAAFAALSCVPAPCSARALPEKIERAAVAGVLPFPSVLCLYLGSAEKIIAIPPASMSAAREGLLYGGNFAEYDLLPRDVVRRGNYTDTADTGDDYLCSLSYVVDVDGLIYVTDAVYTREPMEVTEQLVAEMLLRSDTREAAVESNNGGRGFARAVQALAPDVRVEWFHQSANKEARILSNAATVLHLVRWPRGWNLRWPDLYAHLTTYRRKFRSNRWHDAADVVTGIVEHEVVDRSRKRLRGVRFA